MLYNETSANKILGEVIDKRSEDSKTFLLSNHEFQKNIYPFQVHEINDEGGNITSRKIYAYTKTDLKELLKEDTYVYGNNKWKDQLTSYNNQSISYDEIGNQLAI